MPTSLHALPKGCHRRSITAFDQQFEAVVMPTSRIRMAGLVVGALAFVGLGAWIYSVADEMSRPGGHVIGVVTIAVFGLFAAIGLIKLVGGGWVACCDAGLVSTIPTQSFEARWHEISSIRVERLGRETFLSVRTHPGSETASGAASAMLEDMTESYGSSYGLSRRAFRADVDAFASLARQWQREAS